MLLQNIGKHPDIRNRSFHLMGNIADQLLDRLLILLALFPSLLHSVIILQKLPLNLRYLGILIGLVILRRFPVHERIHRPADIICKIRLLLFLTPIPQKNKNEYEDSCCRQKRAQTSGGNIFPQASAQNQHKGRGHQYPFFR